MFKDEDYKQVHKVESLGYYNYGMNVQIAMLDLNQDEQWIIRRACDHMIDEVLLSYAKRDPKVLEGRAKTKQELLNCFPPETSIYVEETTNGYSGEKYYTVQSPWLIVTTSRGRIKIGWRRSVIVVDWEETNIKTKAETLFKDEDVTKDKKMIHAWGYEKATEYINTILGSE